jgi:hypothetical protein
LASPRASQTADSRVLGVGSPAADSPVATHRPFSFFDKAAAAATSTGITLWPEEGPEVDAGESEQPKNEALDEVFNFDLDLSQDIQEPVTQGIPLSTFPFTSLLSSTALICGNSSSEILSVSLWSTLH